MTDEERSQRQQAFQLIADARRRANPTTTEHIAEVARRNAPDNLRGYIEFLGWKELVYDQEHESRTQFKQVRSGHRNQSGRYGQLRSILEMPERLGNIAKPLGELNLEELELVIAAYEQRAAENSAEAERLARIAEAMRIENAVLVADLGADKVQALYAEETVNVA